MISYFILTKMRSSLFLLRTAFLSCASASHFSGGNLRWAPANNDSAVINTTIFILIHQRYTVVTNYFGEYVCIQHYSRARRHRRCLKQCSHLLFRSRSLFEIQLTFSVRFRYNSSSLLLIRAILPATPEFTSHRWYFTGFSVAKFHDHRSNECSLPIHRCRSN